MGRDDVSARSGVRASTTIAGGVALRLPSVDSMVDAVLARDGAFDGVFLFGVSTTGVFCRPGCPARTPRREHLVFFAGIAEALASGFRACRRCRPLDGPQEPPDWIRPLLEAIDREPEHRFRDADLVAIGVSPTRVRRWFLSRIGVTFHAAQRARRVARGVQAIDRGVDVLSAGFEAGFESASGFADALQRIAGVTPAASIRASRLWVDRIPTPLGPVVAAATESSLRLIEFADRPTLGRALARLSGSLDGAALIPGPTPPLTQLRRELEEYFAGTRTSFDVPRHARGTSFQEEVWAWVSRIPFGETRTYGELATEIGRPRSVRAVGRANGQNPLVIVIPCHRVVGRSGALTGYSGGIARKKFLLEREGALVSVDPLPSPGGAVSRAH